MRELTEFMSLVSDETTRVAKIQEEKRRSSNQEFLLAVYLNSLT